MNCGKNTEGDCSAVFCDICNIVLRSLHLIANFSRVRLAYLRRYVVII